MDFRLLYKPERHLFSIGCNLVQGRLDGAHYDLLASEACLTSFLTIARGDAPGGTGSSSAGPSSERAGRVGLVSWGGTMFEYLMPRLLLRGLARHAPRRGRAGRPSPGRSSTAGRPGVPWGISESAFNAQYADGDYQYQSFGVPGPGPEAGPGPGPGRRPLRHGPGRDGRRPARPWRTSAAWPRRGPRGRTASTRRSTTPPSGCPRASARSSSGRTWPTTRG